MVFLALMAMLVGCASALDQADKAYKTANTHLNACLTDPARGAAVTSPPSFLPVSQCEAAFVVELQAITWPSSGLNQDTLKLEKDIKTSHAIEAAGEVMSPVQIEEGIADRGKLDDDLARALSQPH
jgi:hypothetical protein